ncbi:MAG: hypothetical protein LH469_13150 [Frankiaceae bacterium]|nr:hypothetical protein [Frankiaceae bacterium]
MSDEELITVHVLGFPLQVHARAQQQSAEMRREFQLILGQEAVHPGSVPSRLLDVSNALSGRYSGFTEGQERQIEEGIASGAERLDELVFRVPAHVSEAVEQLGAVLDEADEWCRQGKMLVLATPPDLVVYRNWYLQEFSRQAAGEAPRPWDGPLR